MIYKQIPERGDSHNTITQKHKSPPAVFINQIGDKWNCAQRGNAKRAHNKADVGFVSTKILYVYGQKKKSRKIAKEKEIGRCSQREIFKL
jgi:hypothetical protein